MNKTHKKNTNWGIPNIISKKKHNFHIKSIIYYLLKKYKGNKE